MYHDENLPTTMTAEQSAALLACVRNQRTLLHLVERPLNELVHELLHADIKEHAAPEVYVECHVVGLISALQPLLNSKVVAFFELSDEERKQRWMSFDISSIAVEGEWPADGLDDAPAPLGAWTALDASLRKIHAADWKRLALDVVAKPEAMIHDVRAIEAFRMVLDLSHHGEKCLTAAEVEVINIVGNPPTLNNLLTVLRDLRRTFR
jgi:hypothetical protein